GRRSEPERGAQRRQPTAGGPHPCGSGGFDGRRLPGELAARPPLPTMTGRLPWCATGRASHCRTPTMTTTPPSQDDKREQLRQAALDYHEHPVPGKIAIAATKQLVNQYELSLAYSPGVAAPCEEIQRDPAAAFRYTARGNLVGVITNGTAVLGLGDIGALAGKPVMEGKAVLFKKFSGIDVFDIEINEKDPDKLVEIIAALEPTFG